MKTIVIGTIVALSLFVITGWYSKADAQVVTVTNPDTGETTEIFCYESEGYTFCE